jgi:hypothetical protein
MKKYRVWIRYKAKSDDLQGSGYYHEDFCDIEANNREEAQVRAVLSGQATTEEITHVHEITWASARFGMPRPRMD